MLRAIFLIGAVLLASGCSTNRPALTPVDGRSVVMLAGDGSGPVEWDAVVKLAADAEVVLIGEVHGHRLGLAAAADLFDDILEASPDAVLSLEFFERDHQVAVDDYLAGITDEAGFASAAGRTKGNYPPGHARMLEAAKEAGRPVIASNAPRRYARLVRTDGFAKLDELTPEQQRLAAAPSSVPDTAYSDRFREVMSEMVGSHGGDDDEPDPEADAEMIEGFLRAQTMWDETMADSINAGMRAGTPVVHVVGRFHAEDALEPGGSGLADALGRRARRQVRVVTIMFMNVDAAEVREEDLGLGNFVVYVGASPTPR